MDGSPYVAREVLERAVHDDALPIEDAVHLANATHRLRAIVASFAPSEVRPYTKPSSWT